MNGPSPEKMERMFDSIAPDYDKLNHMLSLGIDRLWRRRALKLIVDPSKAQRILDVACGTGDFSIAIALKSHPQTRITGADLSEGMLEVMRGKVARASCQKQISTIRCNCEALPFDDCSFDRVTIAFGIRNFEHREAALKEFLRVLKPGGTLVVLELSVPENKTLRALYNVYFTKILPVIGGLVSGDKSAYRYLPASVLKFPDPAQWCATMQACGYGGITHKAFTFGLCRMYTGSK